MYLTDNPHISEALGPVTAGSKHFRLEAWNALVRAGILPLLPKKQLESFQESDISIRNTSRVIQMEDAEWARVLCFNRVKHSTPPPFNQYKDKVKSNIESTIGIVRKTLITFDDSL